MKYIPSIAFEEMSGSAKGVTAAKMKNRKYIRNRGYGGSVRTSDQAKVKGVFKRLTTMWKTLANDNILAWNKLALSQQGRSVLGTGAKISGANLFTRLNYWIVASGIKLVEEPTAAAIDIRADYVAKNGAPSAAAPKIFFRYYYVNSSTGEKFGVMLAETTWTAAAAGGGD